MHAIHNELPTADLLAATVDAPVELVIRPGNVPMPQVVNMLEGRLGPMLAQQQMAVAQAVDDDNSPMLVVVSARAAQGLRIAQPRATVLTIREEPAQGAGVTRVLDYLNGWPVVSARELTRLCMERAAGTDDLDLRASRKVSADILRDQILGRQL
jgi:hypothetical protein